MDRGGRINPHNWGWDGENAPQRHRDTTDRLREACRVSSCLNLANGSKGYCTGHYARWLQGNVREDVPLRQYGKNKGKSCGVPSCRRAAQHAGYCGTHYQRTKKPTGLRPDDPIGYLPPKTNPEPEEEPTHLTYSDDGKLACLYSYAQAAYLIFDPTTPTYFEGSRPLARCRIGVCQSAEEALNRWLNR